MSFLTKMNPLVVIVLVCVLSCIISSASCGCNMIDNNTAKKTCVGITSVIWFVVCTGAVMMLASSKGGGS